MTAKVICPRCGQDYLVRVKLIALERQAILCPECDAMWLNEQDVSVPAAGGYGVTWYDCRNFLEELGRPQGSRDNEVSVVGPFIR